MGKYYAVRDFLILVILFYWAVNVCADVNQDFLKCMSQETFSDDKRYVYSPNSPEYSKLLNYAQKNGRWMMNSKESVRRPHFIVSPSTETQVQRTVICSRSIGLQLRVKSGGHDYEGLSFRSGSKSLHPLSFIMLDLINLNFIDIDINKKVVVEDEDEISTAWIQTGVTLGELYYAISEKSQTHAFPGGLYPTIGSGGLISGGGLGTLMRKYGLAADNVLDARIVNADGEIHDRKSMGEDLFWALRGGGGSSSFGVITAWKLKLVRVPEKVTAFTVRRKMNDGDEKSVELLEKWERIGHKLPEDLFLRILIQNVNKKFVQISFQGLFLGKADDLVSLLNIDQNFPEFDLRVEDCFKEPTPISCKDKENPCVRKECYQLPWIRSVLYFAGQKPNINLEYLTTKNFTKPPSYFKAKSDFVKKSIPAAGFEMIRKLFLEEESPMIILDPFGGRMSQISEFETPFPHREGNIFNVQYLVNWKECNKNNVTENELKRNISMHLKWMKRLHKNMKSFVSSSPRGAYVNYKDLDLGFNADDDDDDAYTYAKARKWGEKYYKGNFERLAKVKSMVDPFNFFRNELSIPPFQGY